ncbi:MAG: glutaredoxin family protein [Myxococcota bacterium]|nr:glutaredoxin family protein [Myxococcota bacterium]
MNRTPGLWLALLLLQACQNNSNTTSATSGVDKPNEALSKPPPEVVVTSSRANLLFSYQSGSRFVTANTIKEIPVESRQQVIVTDLSMSPAQRQSGKYIYVADLRTPRANGSYPVAISSRYGLEAELSGTITSSGSVVVSQEKVIVYTTSWCGVCKKALRLLRKWNVPHEEKDIEGSRKAQRELASKAQAAGIQPGGVPVIDVAGNLMQGLDETTLRTQLKAAGFLN